MDGCQVSSKFAVRFVSAQSRLRQPVMSLAGGLSRASSPEADALVQHVAEFVNDEPEGSAETSTIVAEREYRVEQVRKLQRQL